MSISAVVGIGYGDEGKGLVTNSIIQSHARSLVIRHNGGAQSGHTVETPDRRFVFHELSSGSFSGADTFWADSFFPDVYKLREEAEAFRMTAGFVPRVFADTRASITVIDDIIINMAIETARGKNRHGSCGMGIYEAVCRTKAGYGISIGELTSMDSGTLVSRLRDIRENYVPRRLEELGLASSLPDEYESVLKSPNVLDNYADDVIENLSYITPVADSGALLSGYDDVIFETGQGLLLDTDCKESMPNVTASHTGIFNPVRILAQAGYKLDCVYYVTRSYVTKHGNGFLPHECSAAELGFPVSDCTNIPNPWQGSLRIAKHCSASEIAGRISNDAALAPYEISSKLVITHLNETNGNVVLHTGNVPVDTFIADKSICETFDGIYTSYSPYGISEYVRGI